MQFFKLKLICANDIRLGSLFSQSALRTPTQNHFGLNLLELSSLLFSSSGEFESQSYCWVDFVCCANWKIMSPKADIDEQNFNLTKHHLMKSLSRKRNIKYFSLEYSPRRLIFFFSDLRLMKLNVHRN